MKKVRIVVVDGQGGRLGQKLVESLLDASPQAEVTAVGTNSFATERMIRGGARSAATGENALIVACRTADVIVGPMGIVLADALMGEITPAMACAVGSSSAEKVLIPMNLCETYVAGVQASSAAIVQDAVQHICEYVEVKQREG